MTSQLCSQTCTVVLILLALFSPSLTCSFPSSHPSFPSSSSSSVPGAPSSAKFFLHHLTGRQEGNTARGNFDAGRAPENVRRKISDFSRREDGQNENVIAEESDSVHEHEGILSDNDSERERVLNGDEDKERDSDDVDDYAINYADADADAGSEYADVDADSDKEDFGDEDEPESTISDGKCYPAGGGMWDDIALSYIVFGSFFCGILLTVILQHTLRQYKCCRSSDGGEADDRLSFFSVLQAIWEGELAPADRQVEADRNRLHYSAAIYHTPSVHRLNSADSSKSSNSLGRVDVRANADVGSGSGLIRSYASFQPVDANFLAHHTNEHHVSFTYDTANEEFSEEY